MAFGDSRKKTSGGSGATTKDAWPFMDLNGGKRTFRLLPDREDPTQVTEEFTVLSLWLPVKLEGGKLKKRRIFIDQDTRNELPEDLAKSAGLRFFLNVYDRTPVLRDGLNPVYPDQDKVYWAGFGDQRKKVDGKPSPNNAIMVLEGTCRGEESMLSEILSLRGEAQNEEGDSLPMLDFDIDLSVRKGEKKRVFKAQAGINRNPLSADILALPRYDLATWTRAWPTEAVMDLLDGKEFYETVKQYDIKHFVAKEVAEGSRVESDEDLPF